MFKVTEHDFGTVAASAKAEYRFVFENLYMEDVHIASVRTSCGCTTPSIENDTLKTYDKGAILAVFNTPTFRGQRGATLTVTIDRPFYAEVQLHVKGYIRGDVLIEPGSVQMGTIDQGVGATKAVHVGYGGRSDWAITEVRSADPNIKAKVVETLRQNGQVAYQLQVQVDPAAPPRYLNDYLMLVTNDASVGQIPVLVEGRIVPTGITVSPSTLSMGVVQPGQKVTRQLVVKGKTPFRILGIQCDDGAFQFDTSKDSQPKSLHLVPVSFTAGADVGKVVKTIKIKTDQGAMTPELTAYAVVAAK